MRRGCAIVCLLGGLAACADDGGGLDAARDPLGRMIAPVVRDGKLVLDRSAWTKVGPGSHSKEDREAHRREIADGMGVPPEAVSDSIIDGDASDRADPTALFQAIVEAVGGGPGGGGTSNGGSRTRRQWDTSAAMACLDTDSEAGSFELVLAERTGARRTLDVAEDPATGLSIRLDAPDGGLALALTTSAAGRVTLVGRAEGKTCALSEADFASLMWNSPEEVARNLLRPLAAIGIALAPDRCLPEVMAAATSGFGAAAAEIAREADDSIARLSDDDSEVREKATESLHAIFPRAVRHVEDAAARASDPEAQERLRAVIAARPDIERALAYVKESGLHEDRAYLIEVLRRSPSYRASARARLAELCGKDYGDDPAAWPAAK